MIKGEAGNVTYLHSLVDELQVRYYTELGLELELALVLGLGPCVPLPMVVDY